MRYYLTTAIDYVNSRPHLGTAYEKMTADVIARYRRGRGDDVHFVMGNDEHSLKVAQAARDQGLEPLEYCDRMERVFRDVWAALDVEPDDFIRTTERRHGAAVRAMAERIHDAGDFYQGVYEGWYCVGCEAFKREDELEERRCPQHRDRELSWLEERNWFFRLGAYRDRILSHYAEHPEFLLPEHRRNEIVALLERGLDDVSVSRASQDWGVPFPFDPSAVVYVWFDALINYVSAVGFPDDEQGFGRWWPADLHLIGKDITRFHCVIWPAMLMSAGLPLPRTVFGHGFVNMGGDRMSKSSGVMADPVELASHYGADALRYYVCREAPFGHDVEYTKERLEARYSGELSNGLGNLASRLAAMVARYRDGVVPERPAASRLVELAMHAVDDHRTRMDALDLRGGIEAAMDVVEAANVHVERTAPFNLAKDPARKAELDRVLSELAHALLSATSLLFPFMPRRMDELHRRLAGRPVDPSAVLSAAADPRIPAGHRIEKEAPLFPRLDE